MRPGHRSVQRGVQTIPGNGGADRLNPPVITCREQADPSAVACAGEADAGHTGVIGPDVGSCTGIVERYLASATAEPAGGVRQDDVTVPREVCRIGGDVGLVPAEPVGLDDRRRGVSGVGPDRDVRGGIQPTSGIDSCGPLRHNPPAKPAVELARPVTQRNTCSLRLGGGDFEPPQTAGDLRTTRKPSRSSAGVEPACPDPL